MKNIYFSTYGFYSKSLGEILETAQEFGINSLELGSGIAFEPEPLTILKECHDFNFLIHHYFPTPQKEFVINLASQNKRIIEQSLTHCKNAIEFSKEVGSPLYSVHSGYLVDPSPSELGKPFRKEVDTDYQKSHSIFIESIKELVCFGKEIGIKIAIENNVVAPFNVDENSQHPFLMVTSEEIIELKKEVNSDNLYYLIDLGHLKVSSSTLGFDRFEFIESLKDNIMIFHLSDNDGLSDTNKMFNAESWFMECLREFPNTYFSIECKALTRQDMTKVKSLLEEIL